MGLLNRNAPEEAPPAPDRHRTAVMDRLRGGPRTEPVDRDGDGVADAAETRRPGIMDRLRGDTPAPATTPTPTDRDGDGVPDAAEAHDSHDGHDDHRTGVMDRLRGERHDHTPPPVPAPPPATRRDEADTVPDQPTVERERADHTDRTAAVEAEREERRRERDHERDRHRRLRRDEVMVMRWSVADFAVVLIGAAMVAAGTLALIRAGVDDTWYRPRVEVMQADHTAMLGLLEVGAGALLILAGAFRQRVLSILLGAAIAIGGAVAALETARFERELAIEEWWCWVIVGTGTLVVLMGLVPRKARIERVEKGRRRHEPAAPAAAR